MQQKSDKLTKHQRKCIGCNEFKDRDSLIKITKEYNSGKIFFNPDCKTFGRSAYLCYNQSCIDSALKKNKLNKALKTSAVIERITLEGFLKKN